MSGKGFDPACETLAEHFLEQPRSSEDVKALAQRFQDAVEDWFSEQEMAQPKGASK